MNEVIERIFTVNLGVRSGERAAVFTDLIREDEDIDGSERKRREELRDVAKQTASAGGRFCDVTYIEFPSTGSHGVEPPQELWEACFGPSTVDELRKRDVLDKILKKRANEVELKAGEEIVRKNSVDAVNAVVALTNYSTSHTRFRDFLTRLTSARYVSMPLFDRSMIDSVMTADWNKIKQRTENLVRLMNGAETVHITCPNGTEISFSIKGRPVEGDTGIMTEPGSFGNLPAGEAFAAPVEGTANGTLVLDWAPTRKLKDPVTLKVEKGVVRNVTGKEDYAWELEKILAKEPLAGNIAELGVGTNDRASRPDNILETEKILGTVHIAIGDNSSFGGKVSVPFHQDFIFFKPTMKVEKEGSVITVLDDGEPLF